MVSIELIQTLKSNYGLNCGENNRLTRSLSSDDGEQKTVGGFSLNTPPSPGISSYYNYSG
jgi:hypothetical protein